MGNPVPVNVAGRAQGVDDDALALGADCEGAAQRAALLGKDDLAHVNAIHAASLRLGAQCPKVPADDIDKVAGGPRHAEGTALRLMKLVLGQGRVIP